MIRALRDIAFDHNFADAEAITKLCVALENVHPPTAITPPTPDLQPTDASNFQSEVERSVTEL